MECCEYKESSDDSEEKKLSKKNVIYGVILNLLNNHKIDFSMRNEKEKNLFELIINNDFDDYLQYNIIIKMIEKGIDINMIDKDGNNPLFYSIQMNNVYLVRLFINNGININIQNNKKDTPLHYAILLNKIEIVTLLLENNVTLNVLNEHKNNEFFSCVLYNRDIILMMLFEYCKKKMLDYRNILCNNETLFHCYLFYNNAAILLPIFHILNDERVSLNGLDTNKNSILQQAIICNRMNVIYFLLEKNVNIYNTNNIGNNALHHAVITLNVEVAKLLLEKGIDIESKNIYGNTVFHNIMKNEFVKSKIDEKKIKEMIFLLLDHKPNLNSKNVKNMNVYELAKENKNEKYIKYIMEWLYKQQ